MSDGTVDTRGEFQPDEAWARHLDEQDPLRGYRERFRHPRCADGSTAVYLCGNSLGLQPTDVETLVRGELETWARLAVDGHFEGPAPWYGYHTLLRDPLARLVGADPSEVVAMNGLTTNLHLMMVSFYRPTPARHRVLMEDCAFPSDTYAVQSQIRFHGYDPAEALLVARPQPGEPTIRAERFEELLERQGETIALVLLGGINYYTGQWFDLQRLTAAARRRGCVVGLDLAHAVGNVPLRLSASGPDFAVWCSYKYLNGGPGAVAGCFVHRRHAERPELPRFAGWWGNDPEQRFRMHLLPEFVPVRGAEGWQQSNPSVLSMAPLRAALALFDEAGMPALRAKSERLTAYLENWIDHVGGGRIEQLTPRDPLARGCQLSLRIERGADTLLAALKGAGIVVDFRPPDVVRVAPVPLYNSFQDVWRAGRAVAQWAAQE